MSIPFDDRLDQIAGMIERGELDHAREAVESALAEEPGAAEARYYRGVLLLREGDLDGAEAELLAACQEHPLAYGALALLRWERGELAEAELAFCDLLDQARLEYGRGYPELANYLLIYARFLAQVRDDKPEALGVINVVLAITPTAREAYQLRAAILEAQHRPEAAAATYWQGLQHNPLDAEALVKLARIELEHGRVEPALDKLYRARRLEEDNAAVRANLALALKARIPLYGRLLTRLLWLKRPGPRGCLAIVLLLVVIGLLAVTLLGLISAATLALTFFGASAGWGLLALLWRYVLTPLADWNIRRDPVARYALGEDPTATPTMLVLPLATGLQLGLSYLGLVASDAPDALAKVGTLAIVLFGLLLIFIEELRKIGGRRQAQAAGGLSLAQLAATALAFALETDRVGLISSALALIIVGVGAAVATIERKR